MPCYNAAKYIDKFLENIAGLGRAFDEVIFYDDASSDGTGKLLRAKGQRVVEGKENRGPGYARNRLAEAAVSDHIHFHDIDDEFLPAFLGLVDDAFEKQQIDIVVGNADWLDAATREPLIRWRYDAQAMTLQPLRYFIMHPLGIINTVYKKTAFFKAGGFDEQVKCWEDADLHVRLAAAGLRFGLVDQVLAYSLRHDHGISADQLWCWDCRLRFLRNYLEAYRAVLPEKIFVSELKRVQAMYIRSEAYHKLDAVIAFQKQYQLPFRMTKTVMIYYASKLISREVLTGILNLIRKK